MTPSIRLAFTVAVVIVTWLFASTPIAAAQGVIPPGREGVVRDLIGDVGFMTELEGGYRFSAISISKHQVTYTLSHSSPERTGVAGTLVLSGHTAAPSVLRSKNFAITSKSTLADPLVERHLSAAARSVQRRDTGEFFVTAHTGDARTGDAHPLHEIVRSVAGPSQHAYWVWRGKVVLGAGLFAFAALTVARRRQPASPRRNLDRISSS